MMISRTALNAAGAFAAATVGAGGLTAGFMKLDMTSDDKVAPMAVGMNVWTGAPLVAVGLLSKSPLMVASGAGVIAGTIGALSLGPRP